VGQNALAGEASTADALALLGHGQNPCGVGGTGTELDKEASTESVGTDPATPEQETLLRPTS